MRISRNITIGMLAIMLSGAMLGIDEAHAHRPSPVACDIAWINALPGQRYIAASRCRERQRQHQLSHVCRHRPLLKGITVKHVRANAKQRRNLSTALAYAYHTHTSVRHMVALVAGITQESNAYNEASGDGTSVGVLQLISIHGSVAYRMHIPNSVGWFLRGLLKVDHGQRIAQLIQDQQRSAHDADATYGRWVSEAKRTVRAYLGPCINYRGRR